MRGGRPRAGSRNTPAPHRDSRPGTRAPDRSPRHTAPRSTRAPGHSMSSLAGHSTSPVVRHSTRAARRSMSRQRRHTMSRRPRTTWRRMAWRPPRRPRTGPRVSGRHCRIATARPWATATPAATPRTLAATKGTPARLKPTALRDALEAKVGVSGRLRRLLGCAPGLIRRACAHASFS